MLSIAGCIAEKASWSEINRMSHDIQELITWSVRHTSGEHRLACPKCSRQKLRRGDGALALRIERDGTLLWVCHRCAWRGRRVPGEQRQKSDPSRTGSPAHDRHRHSMCTGQSTNDSASTRSAALSPLAAEIWRNCRSVSEPGAANKYLHWRQVAVPPDTGDLRWHPRQKHPSGHVGPALVARITHALTAEPLSLARTWLAEDGAGKAAVDQPRRLLAGHAKRWGVIRLWPDEDVTLGLAIGEGIETVLTAAHGFTPAWATIDAGNMGNFPVLPGVESLTVCVDHDPAGVRAWTCVKKRWLDAGREVRCWMSPTSGADINDHYLDAGDVEA